MSYDLHGITVRKSNDLIQKSRFSLSLQQQKIILYIISKIKPQDKEFKEYEFTIKDFCQACGIDSRNGTIYDEVKEAIKTIADKSIWVKLENGKETLLRWIEKASIENGTIKIRLDNDMKPYLLQLNKNFTMYELVWTLNFKSKYTIRLYELAKSIHFNDWESYSHIYSLSELRTLLGAEKYTTFTNFRLRVLEPSIAEINTISDKRIEYEIAEKQGKKITHIKLKVFTLQDFSEFHNRYRNLKGIK